MHDITEVENPLHRLRKRFFFPRSSTSCELACAGTEALSLPPSRTITDGIQFLLYASRNYRAQPRRLALAARNPLKRADLSICAVHPHSLLAFALYMYSHTTRYSRSGQSSGRRGR